MSHRAFACISSVVADARCLERQGAAARERPYGERVRRPVHHRSVARPIFGEVFTRCPGLKLAPTEHKGGKESVARADVRADHDARLASAAKGRYLVTLELGYNRVIHCPCTD